MIAGFLLLIGGVAQLIAGVRTDVSLVTALGGVWIIAGAVNIVTSSIARRGRTAVHADDLANPAERAKMYQGVTGQLPRGLITLLCAAAAVAIGIWAPALTDHDALRILIVICGAALGFLALLGLLLYAGSGTERAATIPATVVILGFKELPLNNDSGRPYVRFVLDVYPEGMTHYEATVQSIVPALAVPKLAVGAQFSALAAGPEKPDAVIVDWQKPVGAPAVAGGAALAGPAVGPAAGPAAGRAASAVPASAQLDPAGRLQELDALRSQGLVTEAEYAQARARILGSL